jgi:hypothetical protein
MSEYISTFDLCERIRDVLLIGVGEIIESHTVVNNINFTVNAIKNSPTFRPVKLSDLTREQMLELGFKGWDDESKPTLLLIPQWILSFIEDEFYGECINGSVGTFKRDEIDRDHRFGCLAYGVYPSE